jgi:hypothetical protein
VIGQQVKVGTTGKVDSKVGLSQGTPGVEGLWGYIANLAKAQSAVQSFGGNPHGLITI